MTEQNLTIPAPPATAPSVLGTDEQALEAADDIARLIAPSVLARDRERRPPLAEIEAISRSGLLAIAVPREHGGPELDRSTVVEAIRRIARQDPSIAQLLLTHYVGQEVLRASAGDQPKRRIFAEILDGAQLGNAVAERGTANAHERRTTATRGPDGTWRVDGRKYYATGALGARWIAVVASKDGIAKHPVIAYVRPTDPGVTLQLDEWSSFGQRATFSGGVLLKDVSVPDELVLDQGPVPDVLPPRIFTAYDQAIHSAIDVGIARAALEDAVEFVRTKSRPRPETGVARVADEPYVLRRFGEFLTWLHALEALLARGAAAIDDAVRAPALDDENTARASLAVAEVKALAQDLGVQIASAVLELAGASATDGEYGLDRHWRNIRTHTLHDPARLKYVAIGNHLVNGVAPPRTQLI